MLVRQHRLRNVDQEFCVTAVEGKNGQVGALLALAPALAMGESDNGPEHVSEIEASALVHQRIHSFVGLEIVDLKNLLVTAKCQQC